MSRVQRIYSEAIRLYYRQMSFSFIYQIFILVAYYKLSVMRERIRCLKVLLVPLSNFIKLVKKEKKNPIKLAKECVMAQ